MPNLKAAVNKVIIFDWDDTICPSTFVDQCNVQSFHDLPLHFQNLMNEIGRSAERCLAEASKFGQVILITNSDDGWVHYSCKRYIPNLLPALKKYRIVSARTEYENFYPGAPLCWKAAAFAHEVNETFAELEMKTQRLQQMTDEYAAMETGMEIDAVVKNTSIARPRPAVFDSLNSTDDSSDDSRDQRKSRLLKHTGRRKSSTGGMNREVISFGDSMEERTAVKIVSKQLMSMPKSVMFISSPTPEQLIGQLSMLEMHMKYICTNSSALDLEISPQQAEKCAIGVLTRSKEVHNSGRGNWTDSPVSVNHGWQGQDSNGQFVQPLPIGNSVPRMKRAAVRGYDETFSI